MHILSVLKKWHGGYNGKAFNFYHHRTQRAHTERWVISFFRFTAQDWAIEPTGGMEYHREYVYFIRRGTVCLVYTNKANFYRHQPLFPMIYWLQHFQTERERSVSVRSNLVSMFALISVCILFAFTSFAYLLVLFYSIIIFRQHSFAQCK